MANISGQFRGNPAQSAINMGGDIYLPTIWYDREGPCALPRLKHEYERARPEARGDISNIVRNFKRTTF